MTSANGLKFLSRIWTETSKLRFLYLLGHPSHFKSCKLLNARKLSRRVLKSAEEHIKMKNTFCKFIVIIINWSFIGSRFALAPYFSFPVFPRVQISLLYLCSQLNDKLSPFYQYFYNLTVINYLAPPIILSFSGARACVELCLYKEARRWLHMGLTVSFHECFKRDTRCNTG